MKNPLASLIIPLLIAFAWACSKEDRGDPPLISYGSAALLVDSSGNQLFHELSDIPFSYEESYFSNEQKVTYPIKARVSDTAGVMFSFGADASLINKEMDALGEDSTITWYLFIDPTAKSDTLKVVFEEPGSFRVRYEILNGDTVNRGDNRDYLKVAYK